MHDKLDDALVSAHPLLYRERHGKMSETCMFWGFTCGDGWFGLVWEASQALEQMIAELPEGERPCARQVKEKFGTLRLYMSGFTPAMREVIHRAEERSARTCEDCGDPGTRRDGSWVRTLCDRCHGRRI